jgi:uncharacterized membrane protein YfcA
VTSAVVVILTFATLIRSAFGFGEALVAVPLLALLIPVNVAAPTAALISITVAVVVIVQDWSAIDRRAALRLVASTIVGIPFGLLMLTRVPEAAVKGVLGAIIVAFALFSLARHQGQRLHDDRLAWVFGFVAGVLGGAYGMNGPPLVVYGVLRGWSPKQFRATLQGYFLPASSIGMAGYAVAGLWTPVVTRYFLIALPASAVAIALGRVVNRRMATQRFFRYIYIGLIVVGLILLAQATRHAL